MATHVAKVTFNKGEITPLAHARIDLEMYQSAAKTLLNWYVLKEGGARRRSGTRYRGTIKYASRDTRLVDFVFSSTQAYTIEFGHDYCRFWFAGEQIVDGDDPYEITSPYAESDLRSIEWAQSFDVLFIARQSMTQVPQKLTRHDHDDWEFIDVDFVDGPYLPINDTLNGVVSDNAAVLAGATDTLTFASTVNINANDAGFSSTDIGRHIRIAWAGFWFWGKIVTINSNRSVDVTWETGTDTVAGAQSATESFANPSDASGTDTADVDGTQNSYSWRLGAFSDTTGYPGSVAWFEGRLVWGGTPTNPNGIFYSRSNLPEVMSPSDIDGTVTDSHGGSSYMLGRADQVLWVREAARLLVGTAGSVRSLGPADTSQAFGPRNQNSKLELPGGVGSVLPVEVNKSSVYVDAFGQSFNDLYYDQGGDLVSPNISTVAEHMFDEGITELIYQQRPNSLVWALLGDGTLVAATIDRFEKVIGHSRHELADGEVISLCSIPGTVQDELYMVVRRTIAGEQVQYMETLQPRFLRADKSDAWFVDCGGQYSGAAVGTVTGVDWLEGEEIDVLADGIALPRQTVNDASFTLPGGRTATLITFGKPIDNRGALLPPPINTPEGSSKGRKMRVVNCIADLYETLGLKIVSNTGEEAQLRGRMPATPMNQSPPLMTGEFPTTVDGSWASLGEIEWTIPQPLPGTVRALNVGLDYEP